MAKRQIKVQDDSQSARRVRTRAEVRADLKRPGWKHSSAKQSEPAAKLSSSAVSVPKSKPKSSAPSAPVKSRRRLKITLALLLVMILGLVAQVVYQFNYPRDLALPRATVNGQAVGGKKVDQLEFDLMSWFKGAEVLIVVGDNPPEAAKLTDLGASLELGSVRQQLFDYSDRLRLIPFSIWWQRPEVSMAEVSFNQQILENYCKELAKKYDRAAVNSSLKLAAGEQVQATEAQPGQQLDQAALVDQIQVLSFNLLGEKQQVEVQPTVIQPTKTVADLTDVTSQIELAKAKKITIWTPSQDRSFSPTEAEIVGWLKLSENQLKQTTLVIDQAKISAYLAKLDRQVGQVASATEIKMVDGREQARTEGVGGWKIDQADFQQQLQAVLFVPQTEVNLFLHYQYLAPTVRRSWSFSQTQAGLQAKLQELSGRYNVRIAIKQLDGAKWEASVRAGESTPSASTYKLYVAAKLFEQMDAGRIRWTDSILDTNVAGCFERMIVVSTNPCAEEWIRQFGRQNINNFIWSKGISRGTTFTHPTATHTTAGDLLKVEEMFYNGTLARGDNQSRLLNAMSRQMWRSGIPAGTKGWTQDKVGFLWNYVHDAGIVHHPRGTYIMAVMTKGASYATIAQITREVEALMYP